MASLPDGIIGEEVRGVERRGGPHQGFDHLSRPNHVVYEDQSGIWALLDESRYSPSPSLSLLCQPSFIKKAMTATRRIYLLWAHAFCGINRQQPCFFLPTKEEKHIKEGRKPPKSLHLSPSIFFSPSLKLLILLLLLSRMMLVVFFVLFICGLVNSLFYFSPAKFLAWIFYLLPKSPPPPPPPQPHLGPPKNADKAELQMIFSTFDRNGDGFITKQELEESLENLGLFSSDQQLSAMIERFDSNRDGLIDLQEFCQLFESMDQGRQDPERRDGAAGDDDLKEAFDVFDENGDGLISAEELRLVLSSLGLKKPGMDLQECRKMIAKVDVDGDGKVNFEEFKRMMSSGTLTPLS